jgi:acetylornithine/succinyldiaminopimelate/putrescine aminotransferase
MGNEYFKNSFRPLLPDISFLRFNELSDLEHITKKTACVIIEPVQGEAGIIKADNSYLEALRKRCDETDTLLIFDEIQTGMGRTGKLFAFEHYNVVPDILLLAKAFGGGMPLGAFISSSEIMNKLSFKPILGHITTFGGHPVSCAAGKASMDYLINNKIPESIQEKEKLFIKEINKTKAVKEIRSCGLLMAIELASPKHVQKTIKECIKRGLITDWFLFNESSLRIAPPLIITIEEIKAACSILNESINASLQD